MSLIFPKKPLYAPMLGTFGGGSGRGFGRGSGGGPLWDWPVNTEYTFTNLNASGPNGPTASTINSAYSGTNFAGTEYFGAATDSGGTGINGIQRLVIPENGTYKFTVVGARGGSNSQGGGGGGTEVITTGPLTKDTAVLLVVGQQGEGQSSAACGGGGGSFAYIHPNGNDFDNYDIFDIIAAAGGGSGANGQSDQGINSYGMNAVTSRQGGYGDTFWSGSGNSYTRPADGHGGLAEYIETGGRNYQSSGGAGFVSRATMPDNDYLNSSFTSIGEANASTTVYYLANNSNGVFGATQQGTVVSQDSCNEGGSSHPGNSGRSGHYESRSFTYSGGNQLSNFVGPWVGGRTTQSQTFNGHGGFGGGSAGAGNCGGSGAGGGFSGGMGTGCNSVSGGGGSYGRDSSDHANFAGWTRNSVTAPSSRGNQVGSYSNNGLIKIMRTA